MTTLQNITQPNSRRRGFTLVEMLVVAALIAIFAGLAVFNITAQLEREKQKAAIAEARSIATAMSWAYDDLGFFPKIGLLRFNLDNLVDFLTGADFDSMEYHGHNVGNQKSLADRAWRQNYMAAGNADKTVIMSYNSNGQRDLPWPADPWGNPYVGYFIKTKPAESLNESPRQMFIENASERANYFAGIVSYGRNKVPGMTIDIKFDPSPRFGGRLYHHPDPNDRRRFQALTPAEYNDSRLQYFLESSPDPEQPYIRDVGSDDRYYEF